MAREFSFKATLHFTLASHAELTSLRDQAISFCAANGGKFDLITSEDDDNTNIPYYARLVLDLPADDRSDMIDQMRVAI
jgi:hypothetical protein